MYEDVEQPEPTSAGGTTPDLDALKQRLRRQFESWLESLEQMPEIQEEADAPDLTRNSRHFETKPGREIANRPRFLAGLAKPSVNFKMRSDDWASS
jgi:hypothetical protein